MRFRFCSTLSMCCLLLSLVLNFTAFNANIASSQSSKNQAFMLVGFGSTVPSALQEYNAGLDSLDQLINTPSSKNSASNSKLNIKHGFSSRNFLRNKLGQNAQSPEQILADFARQGVEEVFVQSLHIGAGQEFSDLIELAQAFESMPKGIKSIKVSGPLLESVSDAENLASVLTQEEQAKAQEAVVFVGHGGKKNSDLSLMALQAALWRISPQYLVLGLESKPDFADALQHLEKIKAKQVRLVPLMAIAGDHALNDIGGIKDPKEDQNSLFAQLEAKGYQCSVVKHGLFKRKAVLALWANKFKHIITQ